MDKFTDDYPGWWDDGREVILLKDGVESMAVIEIVDVGFDGEDEYPEWEVTLENNNTVYFSDYDKWKIINEGKV